MANSEIHLSWKCDHEDETIPRRQVTSKWLKTVLMDKVLTWSDLSEISTSVTSLKLVSMDRYSEKYAQLKALYGKDLVKNWTERTDPKKYVYEDIAIATYLLLIWEDDHKKNNLTKKQSFVDLGCGNGLLVYILTREGHKGLGIDLKKRKIWDTFRDQCTLKEQSITPDANHLYSDYDWILGNHSDELTPWIPVIAARSSYHCKFFVLPCCFYDFVGKYGRPDKGKTQYASYLDYIEEVIKYSGFTPEQDVLRIPSTKRTCFIGRERSYKQEEEAEAVEKCQNFINKQQERCAAQTSDKHSIKFKSQPQNQDVDASTGTGNAEDILMKDGGWPITYSHQDSQDSGFVSLESNRSVSPKSEVSAPDVMTSAEQQMFKRKLSLPWPIEILEKHTKYDEINLQIRPVDKSEILTSEKESGNICGMKTEWVSNFKVRPVQGNRNCQSVSEDIKKTIVDKVFQLVLSGNRIAKSEEPQGKWQKGGVVPLNKAVELFDKEIMKELKSECGGLQTLLRNHSHIFQVTNGQIRLRDFTKANPWEGSSQRKVRGKTKATYKTTLCYFHDKHPNGCPNTSDSCLYAHGKDDLRKRII